MKNTILCPPPARLRLAGNVVWAELSRTGPFADAPHQRMSAARRDGLRYERKVQAHLERTYPLQYAASPWLRYRNSCVRNGSARRPYYCQPDGLLMDFTTGLITIVEIKSRHTSDAWWQLRQLYEPVLRKLFGTELWQYALLEIVRWYDPHTAFPERHRLMRDPTQVAPGELGVHIYSGRRS